MDDFSRKALQCHNECREKHQVPAMRWAPDLAKEAEEWANKIARANTLKHASQSERKNAGENIAMFSGRYDTAAEQAISMWYSEVEKYNFKMPTFQSGTGHFTQVVWKDSKELGMARVKTPDGKNTYVVARYRPAGNMMGDFEANVFKNKSKDPPLFVKNIDVSRGEEQHSRIVTTSREKNDGKGQQTRVVVKETKINTPQGTRTVKTTTTYTTTSGSQLTNDEPSKKFKSLQINDKDDKASGRPQANTANAKPSGPFQEVALKQHNHYRRLHQVPDLRWSNELARDAQTWADKIARKNTMQHASSGERKGDGENLAYFGGRFGDIGKDSVDMWYSEEKKYKYSNPGFKSGTGHFTQVVWKDSKEVGMGWAKSPDGNSVFIVGRYRPAGNMMGSFDKNVFPPKK